MPIKAIEKKFDNIEQTEFNYGEAIRDGFRFLLANYPEVFAIGQGLWAPWYVGNTMLDLDKEFGRERIIDSPVSELACTGAALGASLCGYRPIVVHPRVDFMVLAIDQIVTQAANWSSMFGAQCAAKLTVRGIINRGGEQGAQHSQALHAWFAHVPGLKVVMPASVEDARDLFIASVLDDNPVLYIDDRWLYGLSASLPPARACSLKGVIPQVRCVGQDITLVAAGHAVQLCLNAALELQTLGVSCEVLDLRMINPLDTTLVHQSVQKTGRVLVVDGAWSNCGLAGEIIARVVEALPCDSFLSQPQRLTLPSAPAPTSKVLEDNYYIKSENIVEKVLGMIKVEHGTRQSKSKVSLRLNEEMLIEQNKIDSARTDSQCIISTVSSTPITNATILKTRKDVTA